MQDQNIIHCVDISKEEPSPMSQISYIHGSSAKARITFTSLQMRNSEKSKKKQEPENTRKYLLVSTILECIRMLQDLRYSKKQENFLLSHDTYV